MQAFFIGSFNYHGAKVPRRFDHLKMIRQDSIDNKMELLYPESYAQIEALASPNFNAREAVAEYVSYYRRDTVGLPAGVLVGIRAAKKNELFVYARIKLEKEIDFCRSFGANISDQDKNDIITGTFVILGDIFDDYLISHP